jgi:hypothetical protein
MRERSVRREETVRVRLTTEESARLAELADAAGMTISDFIRWSTLEADAANRVGRQRRFPRGFGDAVRTLSQVGVALQELSVNAERSLAPVDLSELREVLALVAETLKRLRH